VTPDLILATKMPAAKAERSHGIKNRHVLAITSMLNQCSECERSHAVHFHQATCQFLLDPMDVPDQDSQPGFFHCNR